jgi:hypothetical protein
MTGESDLSKLFIEAEKRRREQIEAAAIEFEFPDWTSAEEEAYAKSLSPSDALARYPFEAGLAIKQMQRELQYDRVQAIAHEAMVFDDKVGSFRHPLPLLHNWLWWQQMPYPDSDFWQTGYLEIAVPEKVGSLTFKARGRIRYFGVRFWPDGLPGGEDNPLPTSDADIGKSLSPLSASDRDKAAKVIFEVWGQDITEARAWEMAKALFPQNRVSRDPFLETFRAIRGAKSPGKQPSND